MNPLWKFIRYTYLSIDPRSLGLFRIVFGCVLLFDLHAHWQVLDYWYTEDGLLPGSVLLEHPPVRRMFSLFFLASSHAGVAVGMAACGVIYLGFLIGWRTRLFQLLAFVAVVSLNGRISLLENGGDTVLNLLAMWTLFLPLGRRLSLDSLLRSLRERVETDASQLDWPRGVRESRPQPDVDSRVVSIAVTALLLQFTCIYLFSGIQKNGYTWQYGTAVHYALHQDRMVTAFGVLLREWSPEWLLALAGWGTYAIEVGAPVLIWSPFWNRHTRLFAIATLPTMHLLFATCLNIGSFSYAMMSFFPLLLATEHWEAARRFLAARTHRRTVYFDGDCGVCFLTVRVLARLDALGCLDFVPNQRALPTGISAETAERTVVVVDERAGSIHTRSDAVAQALRALPFGGVIATAMRLPVARHAFDWLYDRVSQNRTAISQRLGLAACGIPAPPVESPALAALGSSAAAHVAGRIGAELAVVVMLVASYGNLVQQNFAIPEAMRYRQPDWLQALVDYPRLHQGWRMFTPEGPPEEFMLSVEAETVTGRAVDPFNEVASRYPDARFDRIPVRLGLDQFFATYSAAAARDDLPAYRNALENWVLAYPERTGNPDDRIARFELVSISDISPAPGRLRATNVQRRVLSAYREPAGADLRAANGRNGGSRE